MNIRLGGSSGDLQQDIEARLALMVSVLQSFDRGVEQGQTCPTAVLLDLQDEEGYRLGVDVLGRDDVDREIVKGNNAGPGFVVVWLGPYEHTELQSFFTSVGLQHLCGPPPADMAYILVVTRGGLTVFSIDRTVSGSSTFKVLSSCLPKPRASSREVRSRPWTST